MQSTYFRVNNNEYCHITEDKIFITNSKIISRVPLEHTLSESWGIISVFNYIIFTLLLSYVAMSATILGANFFTNPIHYGALFLLFYFMVRIKNGFLTSKTPTITRSNIKSVYFKTPKFSYPRLVVYFKGPAGKTLKRIIPVLYKQEALPILQEAELIKPAV